MVVSALSDTALIEKADGIAERAHRGQVDKIGRPYIAHPRRVAGRVDTAQAKAAALLHDVIEDSPVTAADLVAEGIPRAVVDCVILLTRRDDVPDADYYRAINAHPLARVVKMADLADNSDAARLAQIPEPKQSELRAKYRRAYTALGEPERAAALCPKPSA
ncbi:guanosine-3',5'-bis(diphosphate) 3'-pyrophosphohydrolase [Mycobacterium sp. NPDC050551]|jgi:(p)ppGpp synthase/HD superfamily hydrolase|uniref:guanosine-3',5'-bis(diphosphate) 3'-pyrophosphohydrolase n=1 Tax=Mycobacterium sp. NPDC050551 TaxID=3155407 RepID=UPI00343E455B